MSATDVKLVSVGIEYDVEQGTLLSHFGLRLPTGRVIHTWGSEQTGKEAMEALSLPSVSLPQPPPQERAARTAPTPVARVPAQAFDDDIEEEVPFTPTEFDRLNDELNGDGIDPV
jgi:hypothetical protein